MTHRLLPPSDWPRLAGTALGDVWHLLPVDRSCVLVVEDSDGAIVGTWAFTLVLHAEGVWIDPAHRGGSSVARHLVRGMHEAAAAMRAPAVWTGSSSAEIDGICAKLGGTEVPIKSWVIPMVKGES